MKVTFFLNNIEPQERKLISSIIEERNFFYKNFDYFNYVFLYPFTKVSSKKEFSDNCDDHIVEYHSDNISNDVIESLRQAYMYSLEKADTYGIFCNSAAWILDADKLRKLLDLKEVQSTCFSLRVGEINGVAMKMGPRLPYIDDNFIIFNIHKCREHEVFSRGMLFTSHFENWGKAHAPLFSFFEACVPYGYIYIYSDGSDCKNLYGESLGFFSTAYLYSNKFGFLSVRLNNNKILHISRALLLNKFGFGDTPHIKGYINKYSISNKGLCFKEGVPYLKKRIALRALDLLMALKKNISSKVNKVDLEFRKKYG